MSNLSYRKKILDVVVEIGTKTDNIVQTDFKIIAKYGKIPLKAIQSEFKDMDDLYTQLAIEYYKVHETKSKKIANLGGEHSLATLIRHDLNVLYFYTRDRDAFIEKGNADKSRAYVEEYINNIMPRYYFQVLRFHPSIIPNKEINAQLYANFIVHSMFFFTKKELFKLNPDNKELQRITRLILSHLFSEKAKELKINNEILKS